MTASNKRSAGLLLYRTRGASFEVLLAHPGGPFFARKDAGAWTLPKGEPNPDEDDLACAIREFAEETGVHPEAVQYVDLGMVKQRGGKEVHAWAFEMDWPGGPLHSNTFRLEWPPRSGRMQEFPEIDRLELFEPAQAREKMNPAQVVFLDRLQEHLSRVQRA
jgi:predicted NUDIX family NTP pyrophosphohydrolase